jgi:LysM repeat protein
VSLIELQNTLEKGAGASADLFKQGLDAFGAMLAGEKEKQVRLYVSGAPGMTEQTASVHVLKRLIDAFDFSSIAVQVVYAAADVSTDPSNPATPDKLALLLSGLDPAQIDTATIAYSACKAITFSPAATPPATAITFGVTGAAADGVDLLKTLNVSQALRLQPFAPTGVASGGGGANQALVSGQDPVDLATKNAQLPLLPYRYDASTLSPVPVEVWSWYAGQSFDAALATATQNAQTLVTALGSTKAARLWPAEGLTAFGTASVAGREVLLNLALAGLSYQSVGGGPIVLAVLDDLDPDAWSFLQALHDNKIGDMAKALTELYGPPLGPPKTASAIKGIQNDLTSLSQTLSPATRLTIGQPGKGDWITPLVANATAGQVVVIPIGAVPGPVRDALFATAAVAPVFSDAGLASLPVSLGLPYLQLPDAGTAANVYPGVPAVENEVSDEALAAITAAATARLGLGDVISTAGASYAADVQTVGDFLTASYTDKDPQQAYFAGLGTYYGDDSHDRLMLGGTLFLAALPPQSGLTLDAVFTALTTTWNSGTSSVDLLAALPGSNLAKFNRAVVGQGLKVVAPSEDYIWKETDDAGKTTAVIVGPPAGQTVPATTEAFPSFKFDVAVHFTAPDGPVESAMACRLEASWDLPGAPWVGIDKPGFEIVVNEAAIPVRGGVVGTLKGTELTIEVSYPVEDGVWSITGSVDEAHPLSLATVFALAGGSNLVQMLPAPLNGFADFGLTKVQVLYDSGAGEIDTMVFSLASGTPWQFLASPKLSVNPTLDATVYKPRDLAKRTYRFDIGGTLAIGTGDTITVTAQYPDFQLAATLTDGQVEIQDLVSLFGANVALDAAIMVFALRVQPSIGSYSLDTTVAPKGANAGGWQVPPDHPKFTISALHFHAEGSQSGSLYAFSGSTTIAGVEVDVSASWATGAGWTFEASVPDEHPLTLGPLLNYLGWSDPHTDYTLKGVALGVRTGGTKAAGWHFTAKTDGAWAIPFFPTLQLEAAVEVADNWDGDGSSGRLDLELKGKPDAGLLQYVDLKLFYEYASDGSAKYGAAWGHLAGEIDVDNDGNGTATLTLSDENVGGLIEQMVSWVTGSKFSLEPPWDVLDKISLDGLELIYSFVKDDKSQNTIGLKVPVGPIDLVFCRVDALEISYRSNPAKQTAAAAAAGEDPPPGVMIQIDGFFPWVTDSKEGTTSSLGPWDTSQPGSAPAPPGNGSKYLDVRMLALGQHVLAPGLASATDIQTAIADLGNLKVPVGDQIPPVTFDASAGWLVGADLGVLQLGSDENGGGGGGGGQELVQASAPGYFITAQFVFADPTLYGLRIALDGKPARILKGLDFQIMYRQVSPTVGVYQAELTLPDAARHLSVGAYSITLPVIAVSVYTNGDFLIDIGFPWNADFSRSLTISGIIAPGIPVTGSAGLYFGVLSSATTDKVPVTSLGTFNPVVVFGFGLQVGFGASVDYGILSAGFSVTVVGILEGVIGKFNPYKQLGTGGDGDDAQLQTSYYFALTGTVGIVGKLYGTVDFAIVKADVNVEVELLLTLTYESYVSITMTVLASVDVSVSISIDCGLFSITIHFSFSMQLKETFTIENHGTPPWGLPPASGGGAQTRPAGMLQRRVESRLTRFRARELGTGDMTVSWGNLEKPGSPAALTGYLSPALTVAADEWGQASPSVCFVAMLALDSMTPASGAPLPPPVPATGFSLTASPAWLSTIRGAAATIDVEVSFDDGYSGTVTLSASGLANATSNTPSVSAPGQAQLTITPATGTPGGSYPITITAKDATGATATSAVTLVVDSSFDTLCKTVTLWVLAAIQTGPTSAADLEGQSVSDVQLEGLLKDVLQSTPDQPTPISPGMIDTFLGDQVTLDLSLPASGTAGTATAAFFPAPPGLSIAVPSESWSYTIGDFNQVSDQGLAWISEYFQELAVQVAAEGGPAQGGAAEVTTTLSVGAWLFADYFLMLARQLVQALRSGLRDFKYPIEPGQTVAAVLSDVNAKAGLGGSYTAADLFVANPAHPLTPGKAVQVGGVTVTPPSAADKLPRDLTTIASDWRLQPGQVAGANALSQTLLATGVTLTYTPPSGGQVQTHPVGTGDSLLSIAKEFGNATLAALYGATTVSENGADVPLLSSQTVLADAPLTVPAVPYRALAGASFEGIAGEAVFAGGFTQLELATANAGLPILQAGAKVDYTGKPEYVVAPLDTLGDVANKIGVDLSDLLALAGMCTRTDLIATAATLTLPGFTTTTQAGDTLEAIGSRFGIETAVLGDSAIATTPDLFATVDASGQAAPYLDVPHLPEYEIGALIDEAQRSLAFQSLSAMASRFFFHGLRLPTDQITPAQAGMWVEDSGGLKLPEAAGLYALTGQQFPIAAKITADYTAATIASTESWLVTVDGNGNPVGSLSMAIAPGDNWAQQIDPLFSAQVPLTVGLTELGAGPMSASHPAKFSLISSLTWQSPVAPDLPYGGAADAQALRIWQFPDALVNLPEPPPERAQNPRFSPEVARFDEATGATATSVIGTYGWATELGFKIKRVSSAYAGGAAAKYTYQVVGVADTDVVLLERLIAQLGSDGNVVERLIVGYPPDATGSASKGVQTDPVVVDPDQPDTNVTRGIAKVNLSTETLPPDGVGVRALFKPLDDGGGGLGLLNASAAEFVQLLWEASISRSGGFYLFYYDSADKRGLPDRVFDGQDEADLTLLLVYGPPTSGGDNRLANYMNALVTGEGIDPTQATVFVQADPPSDPAQTISLPANASLGSLAYQYYSDVGDLAVANESLALAAGAPIAVTEGSFQVPVGGLAVAAIAAQFGLAPAQLTAANPPLADPVPELTAVNLPPLALTAGSSQHTASLADVSGFYGQSVPSLAAANAAVAPMLAATQPGGGATIVTIPGGPMVRAATVSPGVEALYASRPVPADIPAPTDPSYAQDFLLHAYTLLGCQVAQNGWFDASKFGIPIGPTTDPADPDSRDKIRRPRALEAGDPWDYRRGLPYPDLWQGTGAGPYRGVGDLLQVEFAWQDLYGNTLPTDLSNPTTNTEPLNKPPLRVGYTDALIGLAQWPAVGSNYQIKPGTSGGWQLLLTLSFDVTRYTGVIGLGVASDTITLAFTGEVDATSGAAPANYTITYEPSGTVEVTGVTLTAGNTEAEVTVAPGSLEPNVTYTIGIQNVTWASTTTTFVGGGNFTTAGPDDGSITVRARGATDLRTYARLQDQLTDALGVGFSIRSTLLADPAGIEVDSASLLTWLFTGAQSVAGYLASVADGTLPDKPPHELRIPSDGIAFTALNAAQIFELATSFAITRKGGVVEADLATTAGIREVVTTVAAWQDRVPGAQANTTGLDVFAKQFEKGLTVAGEQGYRLKVATGVDRDQVTTASSGSILWAVRVGAPTGIAYSLTDDPATIFAPRPVSTTLQTQVAMIYPYTTGSGIATTGGQDVSFTGVDLDGWCRQLFAAVDAVLTPEYTAAMQIAYDRVPLGGGPYLDRLLVAKTNLATAASDLMAPVFDASADAADAQQAFLQNLLVRLSNAYAVRAGLQYAAAVTADTGESESPRLFGNVTGAQPSFIWAAAGDPKTAPDTVIVQFNDTIGPAALDKANYTVSGTTIGKVASTDSKAFTLTLDDQPVPGTTTVTVSGNVENADGVALRPPFTQPVEDAPPRQTPFTYSSPKLTLATAPKQPLTLLMSAPDTVVGSDGEVVSYVDLDLEFDGTAIEHQIQKGIGPDVGGYVASSWLSFVVEDAPSPFHADLGRVQVPMILRDYPAIPSIPSQTGTGVGGDDLATIRQWTYRFAYSLPFHYPQDRVDGKVEFNLKEPSLGADAGFPDAFAQLAEFVTVWPQVNDDLGKYLAQVDVTTTDTTTLQNASAAANAFVYLAEQVGTAAIASRLRFEVARPRLVGDVDLTYAFHVDEGSVPIGGHDALLVKLTGKLPPQVSSAKVVIDGYTPVTPPPVTVGGCDDPDVQCFVYKASDGSYLAAEKGQAIADRTIELDGLDILERQDARPSVFIERNKRLVPDKDCLPEFVYTTPPTTPTSPLYPTIDSSAEIPIAPIGTPPSPRTLEQHFSALFTDLLSYNTEAGIADISVQVHVAYAYELITGFDAIELPVLMQPPMSVTVTGTGPGTLAQMEADWAGAITTWFGAEQPQLGGTLWLDLLIMSDQTATPTPLLRLRRLCLPLSAVTDPLQ